MRRAECIINIYIAQRGELIRKSRIVLFFFGMEAQVLQEQHFTRLQIRNHLFNFRSNAVRRELHWFREQFTQSRRDRLQTVLRFGLSLRAAKMAGEDDRRPDGRADDGGEREVDEPEAAGIGGHGRHSVGQEASSR